MVNKPHVGDGISTRVVDESDPAQLPHPPRPKRHRSDTGRFVSAGVAVGLLLVGAFAYFTHRVEKAGQQLRPPSLSASSPDRASGIDSSR